MNEPLVSIVIPTYNRAWILRTALASALAQSYAGIEVIVMDNASVDETRKVAQSFADPRLVYHCQPRNVGMIPNWGAALMRARGEFIVFLADDDELRTDFVANRARYLADDPRVNVVFSRYDVHDQAGNLLYTCNKDLSEVRRLEGLALLEAVIRRQWFVGAALYRREAIVRLWPQIAEDNLVLDFGLNIRLAMTGGQGIYIPDNDFVMMAHAGQNSQAKRALVMQEGEDTLQRILRGKPPASYAMALRRELANWNVVWGRLLFSQGQSQAGRARFARALHWEPRLRWAWQQLALSCIAPRRLRNLEHIQAESRH